MQVVRDSVLPSLRGNKTTMANIVFVWMLILENHEIQ